MLFITVDFSVRILNKILDFMHTITFIINIIDGYSLCRYASRLQILRIPYINNTGKNVDAMRRFRIIADLITLDLGDA